MPEWKIYQSVMPNCIGYIYRIGYEKRYKKWFGLGGWTTKIVFLKYVYEFGRAVYTTSELAMAQSRLSSIKYANAYDAAKNGAWELHQDTEEKNR